MHEVIAWVMGEYARVAKIDGYSIEDIVDLLAECIERPCLGPPSHGFRVGRTYEVVSHGFPEKAF